MSMTNRIRKLLKPAKKQGRRAASGPARAEKAHVDPPQPATADHGLVSLFAFRKDGAFDYEAYRAAQLKKAGKDSTDVWADPKTLDLIAGYVKAHVAQPGLVVCHGSKGGMESTYLGKQLGWDAIGTDIAPPPSAEGVVEWDFHERNEAWAGRAAVVYTNALDHAYDPKKAVDAWFEQLTPDGLIFVEHTMLHAPQGASATDPFGAHPLIMPYLVLEWGEGRYCVREILKPAHKKPHWKAVDGVRPDTDLDIWVFVIGRTA